MSVMLPHCSVGKVAVAVVTGNCPQPRWTKLDEQSPIYFGSISEIALLLLRIVPFIAIFIDHLH
jgi:hypothetical protein